MQSLKQCRACTESEPAMETIEQRENYFYDTVLNKCHLRVTVFRRGILNLRYIIPHSEIPGQKAPFSHTFLTP